LQVNDFENNQLKAKHLKIFAYGSNLCLTRILDRVPSAKFMTKGWVDGFQLRLHKTGQDGSGKANCFYTGQAKHRVYGVIYTIDPSEKKDLDRHEGLGFGYQDELLEITTIKNTIVTAKAYIASSAAINDDLLPFNWYLKYIIQGVQDYNFPADYQEMIKSQPSIKDKDPKRLGTFEETMLRHQNIMV